MLQFTEGLFRLQNYIYGNNQSSNSSCPSSPVKWCIDEYDGYKFCIQNPTVLPTCILALLIGLFCSKRISKLPGKFPARWFYHLTFFLYGIMMTSAGILHCFLGDHKNLSNILQNTDDNSMEFISLLVAVIDAGLTTNIAITFLFCGLCDIGFLNPKIILTRIILFCIYLIVFLLWTLGILNNWKWIFYTLYVGVISICCLIYLLTQLCIKSNRRALPALLVGGIYGAMGLLATSFGANHVCQSEGPFWSQYIGPEFIWFLFSDISMAFIFIYVLRANREKQVVIKKYDIDIEKNPEKI